MADNFKLALDMILSANADYSDEDWAIDSVKWAPYEIDPTEWIGPRKLSAATGGTTFETSNDLSTSAVLAVKNLDSSNYVQVAWTDLSGTACVARVLAGGILVVPAINPSTDPVFTANGAAVACKVVAIQTA